MATEVRNTTSRITERTFGTLQLSNNHLKSNTVDERQRPAPKIVVTGFDYSATTAIRASNQNGDDFIEVPWSGLDSVLYIMKRIEDILCIPLMSWRLAGDGKVLKPGDFTCDNPIFRKDPDIHLVLVPISAVDEYIKRNRKKHEWKALAPGPSSSSHPREQAAAFFHLISPVESDAWQVYIQQRTDTNSILQQKLDEHTCIPLDPLLMQICTGVEAVLAGTSLDMREQAAVTNGVVPLYIALEDVGDTTNLIGEAEVLTRIYSPTMPAAVDIHFRYNRRLGVEYDFTILYRIYSPVTCPSVERCDVFPKAGQEGWHLLFSLGFKDVQVDHGKCRDTVNDNTWGPSPEDIERLHGVLFKDGCPLPRTDIRRVTTIDTLSFLLAAVGVPFCVARTDEDAEDGLSELIGGSGVEVRWEINDPGWVGREMRRACRGGLWRDAELM